MDEYEALLRRIYPLHRGPLKEWDLTRMERFCTLLGNPQDAFWTVHVTGSNGKGSLASSIAVALWTEGKGASSFGLFTSPHLHSFRERIVVDGKPISRQEVCHYLPPLLEIAEHHRLGLSFFEIVCGLAFCYFAARGVEGAVLEVGCGGRLDATNVVHRTRLCLITSISFEHVPLLGSTLEEIATEKAAIAKPGSYLLLGPTVPRAPVEKKALELSVALEQIGSTGDWEQENGLLLDRALDLLDIRSAEAQAAAKSYRAPCRGELMAATGQRPPIYLDVAHNEAALAAMCRRLMRQLPNDNHYQLLFGLSEGRQIQQCARPLIDCASCWRLLPTSHPRLIPPSCLREGLLEMGVDAQMISLPASCHEALQSAFTQVEPIVICGSFFFMAEMRHCLGLGESSCPLEANEQYQLAGHRSSCTTSAACRL